MRRAALGVAGRRLAAREAAVAVKQKERSIERRCRLEDWKVAGQVRGKAGERVEGVGDRRKRRAALNEAQRRGRRDRSRP